MKTGDIQFVGFNAIINDSFSIQTLVDIPANTTIHFTDSEWNGARFGLDENNAVWNSGNNVIEAGTVIHFSNPNEAPTASIGSIHPALRISKKEEAIFAYIGSERVPKRFLAAMANDKKAYKTLNNTGLEQGVTAIIFPNKLHFSKREKQNSSLVQNVKNESFLVME